MMGRKAMTFPIRFDHNGNFSPYDLDGLRKAFDAWEADAKLRASVAIISMAGCWHPSSRAAGLSADETVFHLGLRITSPRMLLQHWRLDAF
jgi:hypothetical protein